MVNDQVLSDIREWGLLLIRGLHPGVAMAKGGGVPRILLKGNRVWDDLVSKVHPYVSNAFLRDG